jgi:sugar lactone lactonase YvrE
VQSTIRQALTSALALLGLALPLAVAAPAQADPSWPSSYALPDATAYPESIAYQPGGNAFFVSSYGNGNVYRGTLDSPTTSVFIPGDSAHTSATGVKDDGHGHLYVLRPTAAVVDVYDDTSAALEAELPTASYGANGLLNDVALAPDGTAYITDSYRPYVFRVRQTAGGGYTLDKWLDLTGSVFTYTTGTGIAGLNANGIAVTADGGYLIVNQTNSDALYRVTIASGAVAKIDQGGANLGDPDGMNFGPNQVLYLAGNAANTVSELTFNADWTTATLTSQLTNSLFEQPSSALPVGDRLLVTEFQHDVSTPTLPFTVSSLPL